MTDLDMHFTLRLQHARREDMGAEQGQEGSDDGLVLVSKVHADAGVATSGVGLLLVYQLHHRDDAGFVNMPRFRCCHLCRLEIQERWRRTEVGTSGLVYHTALLERYQRRAS